MTDNRVKTIVIEVVDPFGYVLYSFRIHSSGVETLSWQDGNYTLQLPTNNADISYTARVSVL